MGCSLGILQGNGRTEVGGRLLPPLFAAVLVLLPAQASLDGGGRWGWSALFAQARFSAEVVVVGSVLDRTQNVPVPQAWVQLAWLGELPPGFDPPGGTTLTDSDGRFAFQALPVGQYRLSVDALGYRTLSEEVKIEGSSPFTLSVRLAPEAIELEGIVVASVRNPWLEERGFYRRQLRGMGTTFTADDIRDLRIHQVTDLFRMVSGVTLQGAGSPVSPYVLFRGGCRPDVVIDGTNFGPNVRIDDQVPAGVVQGIEIYRGATSPGLFSSNPCGAVLIWTLGAASHEGRPWSWWRAGFAGGILLMGFLMSRFVGG
jgi:hypothetical protein